MPVLNYEPPASLSALFTEPRYFNFLVGPIGSTKTTACIMFLFFQMCRQTANPADGVSRSRYALSRNTLVQLKMTVLRDIIHLLGPICKWRPSENLLLFDIPATATTPRIYSEWFLIPLDTIDDQRRLLSTQFSGIYLNECREIDFDIITAAGGRVGRWPRTVDGGCTFPFLLGDTNPPAKFSDLYNFCEIRRPDNMLFIRQPGAFEEGADWLEYHHPRYYDNLVQGQSEEWIRVHVHGEYGRDPFGQAVFGHCFERVVHARRRIAPLPGQPLIVGFDPGLNPAACIGQMDPDGGARIFREAYAQGMGTAQFLRDHILPLLYEEELAYRPVIMVMDPAGLQRNPNAGDTAYGIARKTLSDVRLAGTNRIDTRVNIVERHLVERTRKDTPRLLIDPVHCPVLLQALDGEYKYIRKRLGDLKGQVEPVPLKNHPWSDVVDALGYLLLGATLPRGTEPRHLPQGQTLGPSALAWT